MVVVRHKVSGFSSLLLLALLAGCGTSGDPTSSLSGQSIVGHYKVGKPYQVKGRWYRPEYDPNYAKVGTASWYGADFHGLPTANGEVFDKDRISAAHPTLPLPSIVRVTNLENGRSLDIRVNDRGPFIGDRVIDLSEAAARALGYEDQGLAKVRVQFVALADDARGARPSPPVARAAPKPAAAPAPAPVRSRALAPPPAPEVQLAALELPPARHAAPACGLGPQLIQIGAFGETDQVSAALAMVEGLAPVRVEPAFAGGRALARVRLGPVADPQQAGRLLERVVALGYSDAFLVPVTGFGQATLVSC
jgi:rare lipoprotein A